MPAHDQRCHSRMMTSFVIAKSYLDAKKIPHSHGFAVQAGINVARDMLVAAFMDTGMETMIFWDTDIEADLRAFQRILHCPYHIAGGVYAKKKLDLEKMRADKNPEGSADDWCARNLKYAWNANAVPTPCGPDGFMPVRSLPTGFMKVRRCVIEEIMRQHPELQYEDDGGKLCYALFMDTMWDDPVTKKRVRFSEDFSFCHKAAKAGFQCYADLESKFNHIGTFEFPSAVWSQCQKVGPAGPQMPVPAPSPASPLTAQQEAARQWPGGVVSLPPPPPMATDTKTVA